MEEKKGGAAARHLCINSNTRVGQDMHAHGMRETEMQTHSNRSGKENVAYLYHHLCPRYGISGG